MVPDLVHQQFAHPHGFGLLGRNLAFATLRADGGSTRKIVEKRCFGFRKCHFWHAHKEAYSPGHATQCFPNEYIKGNSFLESSV